MGYGLNLKWPPDAHGLILCSPAPALCQEAVEALGDGVRLVEVSHQEWASEAQGWHLVPVTLCSSAPP